ASLLLFFPIFRRLGAGLHLSFLSCLFLGLTTGLTRIDNEGLSINASLLSSSTIMMSETPFLFFVALTVYAFLRLEERSGRATPELFSFSAITGLLKQPYFYLFLFALSFAFHIRTAGISVFGFVMLYWLYQRRWSRLAAAGAGYALLAGQSLGGSSYIGELFRINPYRPELGQAGIGDFVTRFFNNLQRYVTKEIPVGSLPITIDYDVTTAGDWLFGLALLAVAGLGLWRLNCLFLGSYFVCLFGVILLWPDVWTGARFLLPGVPFIVICVARGLHELLVRIVALIRLSFVPHPLWLSVGMLFYMTNLKLVAYAAYTPYQPEWQGYFELAKWAAVNTPPDAVIACRSPYLFAMYADRYTSFYANTLDDKEMLQAMEKGKVTHFVLDQLGFSSTARYLFPAIEKNMDRFTPIHQIKNPNDAYYQYLLKLKPKPSLPARQ
ncbi:MAG: hypothetical protein FJY97_14435, partial [candidate division Zixibacteria bacterium]|nr:hypothetical protein [candidate division Zixibacteria bacterium]